MVAAMAHTFGQFVGWIWNNVAGNFVASVLWAVPGLAWHHRRLKRHVTAEVQRLHVLAGYPPNRDGAP